MNQRPNRMSHRAQHKEAALALREATKEKHDRSPTADEYRNMRNLTARIRREEQTNYRAELAETRRYPFGGFSRIMEMITKR